MKRRPGRTRSIPAPKRHGPGIEERDLDVEEQENHRHQVELDRLALAGITDRRHAAFIRRELFRRGTLRADQVRQSDRHHREPDAEADHDEDGSQPCMRL